MLRRSADRIDRAYVALAIGLFLAMLVFTANRQWSGDFWEHLAVVREFARHPWNPRHPLFAVDAPHPFASPYLLLAGLVARWLHLMPLTVMAAFGMANLLMLLVSFRLFVGALLGARTPFYGLVFTLLLWGQDPWMYSGFLHLKILGFVLAYPSIFAMAAAMLSFYAMLRFLERGRPGWAVTVACGAAVILLTHPITGIVLAVGLVAFSLPDLVRRPARVLALAAVVGVTCLVAVRLWPYYPWISLITIGSETYRDPNVRVFEQVLPRTWPLLAAVPLMMRRWRLDPLDRLSWFVAGLALLYTLGAVLDNGPLGRVLPALALGLHLVLADAVAEAERRWTAAKWTPGIRGLRAFVAAVVILGLLNIAPGLIRMVPRQLLPPSMSDDPRLERLLDLYSPLVPLIGADEVVMADASISTHLPGLTGKVVGFGAPEAFIEDELARRHALNRFFGDATTEERRALLSAYGASFVVVDRRLTPMTAGLTSSLNELGDVIRDDGRLVVVKVRPSAVDRP